MWLNDELAAVFGIKQSLPRDGASYLRQSRKNLQPFSPASPLRALQHRDAHDHRPATSTLEHHQAIRTAGRAASPTFRRMPSHIDTPGWIDHIDRLSEVSGIDAGDYAGYIRALEQRRQAFKRMGATATDHGPTSPQTLHLSQNEAQAIFARARRGEATPEDAARFTAHMLTEMARMSAEDGLVMQLHPGALRNHNESLYARFGPDMGADIPLATEYTRNLQTLLNLFGNNPDFTLILFTVDETTFSRELARWQATTPPSSLAAVVVLRQLERYDPLPPGRKRDRQPL